MIRIFKYNLKVEDKNLIKMPVNAKILSVQVQHGEIALWAEVEEDNPVKNRAFYMAATGGSKQHIPEFAQFIGTVQLNQGYFVAHIYDNGYES